MTFVCDMARQTVGGSSCGERFSIWKGSHVGIRMLEGISENLHRIVLQKDQVMAHKHIPIETWLEALGLQDYRQSFHQHNGVEDLLNLTEAEVKELGVKNGAHRAKIVSSLRILKEKYERGYKVPPILHRSHSASAQLCSTNSTLTYPDYQVVNVSPERLEHDLISELKSDPSELKHWPWYHGSIHRQHAEALVKASGDFLLRDCISQPGDFVLTCCWRGTPLHFMINTEVSEQSSNNPDITYSFEEDKFCSIQDLIQFHLSHSKPITKLSNTVISNPIARTMPLSYYDVKYGFTGNLSKSAHYSPVNSPKSSPNGSPHGSPNLHRRPMRVGSQPLLVGGEKSGKHEVRSNLPFPDRCDSLPSIHGPDTTPFHQGHMTTSSSNGMPFYHQRAGSEPVVNQEINTVKDNGNYLTLPPKMAPSTSDSHLNKAPPPKPSRIPSVKYIGKDRPKIEIRNKDLYQEDDRDYSDYSQVKAAPSWLNGSHDNQILPSNTNFERNNDSDYDNNFNKVNRLSDFGEDNTPPFPVNDVTLHKSRKRSDTRFSILDSRDYCDVPVTPVTPKGQQLDVLIENSNNVDSDYEVFMRRRKISVPKLESNMSLNPATYSSGFLPEENKPLEPSTLLKVKELLLSNNIHKLAQHFTQCDLDLCEVVNESDLGLGVTSGLELVTLPHGKQLRQDIIESCYCTKAFVMVMILTCGKVMERAQMLSQWIQIAAELKTNLGNLFGFANIMEGLTASQVLRLRDTWLLLRQNHTNSAFLFDTKLKAAYKSLNDGSGLLPLQNVSIPDVAPLVFLMERDQDSLLSCLPWELSDQNSGLDIFLTHLDTARLITAQSGLYRVTAQTVMKDHSQDGEVLDIFRTEFQMRLMWGIKGCIVNRNDRQSKFEQLLTALSNRAEIPGDDGTAL